MKLPEKPSKHAILMTFDQRYLNYGLACLQSMSVHYPDHPDVYVCYEGEHPQDLERIYGFERVYPITFLDSDQQIEGLDYGLVGSKQVYMRFYAWSHVFDVYEKVMYLDADCLVLHPLDHMFQETDFYILADLMTKAADCWVFKLEYANDMQFQLLLKEDGFVYEDLQYTMCNAGVFVVPKKYRTPGYAEELWEIARKYNHYLKLGDQSVISIWCAKHGIQGKHRFEDNLQTAGLFYFNQDLEIGDIRGYSSGKTPLNIFHFSYLKPHALITQRYRANYLLFYDSFKKYQYYLMQMSQYDVRPERLDIHDISVVLILDDKDTLPSQKQLRYFLTYLEKTYMEYELIVVEYGQKAMFEDVFKTYGSFRYHFMEKSTPRDELSRMHFVSNLANNRKVLILKGLRVPHPKSVLEGSLLLEGKKDVVLLHGKQSIALDLKVFKKKRGKLPFFPLPRETPQDWSAYGLRPPGEWDHGGMRGYGVLLDRILLHQKSAGRDKKMNNTLTIPETWIAQLGALGLKTIKLEYPYYVFEANMPEIMGTPLKNTNNE